MTMAAAMMAATIAAMIIPERERGGIYSLSPVVLVVLYTLQYYTKHLKILLQYTVLGTVYCTGHSILYWAQYTVLGERR